MFKVICTGKNDNYGGEGQKRELSDHFIITALKEGWILPKVEYIGSRSAKSSESPVERRLVVIKKENVENLIQRNNYLIEEFIEKLKLFMETNKDIVEELKKENKK